MKKTISVLLILSTIFCFCSCENKIENKNEKLNIVATMFPQYDFARAVAKDKANIEMLLKPGTESHTYDPTPQDILKIRNSDIFIYNGGESDQWVEKIISSIDTSKTTIVALMEVTDNLKEEQIEGMDGDDDDEDEYDEHIWTSPKNAIKMVEKVAEVVISKDKENTEYYKSNEKDYVNKISELDKQFENVVNNSKAKTIVFGDRFPFLYFTKCYGLSYYAAFKGCSDQSEPSAKTLAFLVDKVKAENIPVVFYTEFSNQKIADTICEATGVKKLMLHSCHNVTVKDFESGITYAELMSNNLENIVEALS